MKGRASLVIAFMAVFPGCNEPGEPAPPLATTSAPSSAATTLPRRPSYLGVVVPKASADLAFKNDGKLALLDVRLGDKVARGAVVAKLDDAVARAEVDLAIAQLRGAEADAAAAASAAAEQQEKLERRRSLAGSSAPLAAEEIAGAAHAADTAKAVHAAARARVDQRGAELRRLQAVLAESTILAPFDGVVAQRSATPGATVTKGAVVVRLVASDAAIVRFAVPETEMGGVERGAKVAVRIDGERAPLTASIDAIGAEVDAASRMVFVEARVEASASELEDVRGRTARVTLL